MVRLGLPPVVREVRTDKEPRTVEVRDENARSNESEEAGKRRKEQSLPGLVDEKTAEGANQHSSVSQGETTQKPHTMIQWGTTYFASR